MNALFNINDYFFNAYAFAYFFAGIFVSAEALFVYIQNRKSMINISFAAVTVCAGIWLTGVGFMFSCILDTNALIWSRYYSWFGIIFITPCLYLFSLAWAGKSIKQKRAFLVLNFLSALGIYIVCCSTPYIIKGMWPFPWGYYPKAGVGHGLFLAWFGIQVFLIFRNFLYSYNNEESLTRKLQTKYIIIAFIFGVFMGSIDFIANYGFPLHSIGSVAIVIFSSIIAYSIVNYKIMDIETVIHKTILWVLSFSIITVPLLLIYSWAYAILKDYIVLQIIFWTMSLSVFAIYMRLVQPKIDHLFQRRRANLEEISNLFIEELVHLQGFGNLIQYIDTTIANTLYPQWVDIFIFNNQKKKYILANRSQEDIFTLEVGEQNEFLLWLKTNKKIVYSDFVDIDPVFADIKETAKNYFDTTKAIVAVPLILNDQLLGVINLGKKANLSRYNVLDFQFLTTLKNQSAIAISNSLIYQNIEEQVEQRTEELLSVQKQLIQAEKLATVGTLSGGVAHEINNPLTAILTNVQILLSMCDDEGTQVDKESLELMEEATQRCRTIVQKLMAYSKKPMQSSEFSKINLADALNKVITFLHYQLEQDNVKVISEVQDGEYPVWGNHNEMEQVITNIILNARDAIVLNKGKGSIHVSLKKEGVRYKLAIKDNGGGIAEDVMTQIFDPFFTTKDVGKGLGLGLSICHSIIEKHNGKIDVEPKDDDGARFTIDFPEYSKTNNHSNTSYDQSLKGS